MGRLPQWVGECCETAAARLLIWPLSLPLKGRDRGFFAAVFEAFAVLNRGFFAV